MNPRCGSAFASGMRADPVATGLGMSTEPEPFLARWSRRKREAEREAERPAEGAATALPAAPPSVPDSERAEQVAPVASSLVREADATTDVPLPPIESLDGLRSDYQAFFQQPVSDDLRRAALKKLFADPHFNQMDMLDVYVDDYTQFEPLPAAMRMRLPSARAFLLDSERAAVEAADAAADAAGEGSATPAAAADEERELTATPAVDETGSDLAAEGPDAESASTLTAAPVGVPPAAASTQTPESAVRESSSSAVPPGPSAAPESSST